MLGNEIGNADDSMVEEAVEKRGGDGIAEDLNNIRRSRGGRSRSQCLSHRRHQRAGKQVAPPGITGRSHPRSGASSGREGEYAKPLTTA